MAPTPNQVITPATRHPTAACRALSARGLVAAISRGVPRIASRQVSKPTRAVVPTDCAPRPDGRLRLLLVCPDLGRDAYRPGPLQMEIAVSRAHSLRGAAASFQKKPPFSIRCGFSRPGDGIPSGQQEIDRAGNAHATAAGDPIPRPNRSIESPNRSWPVLPRHAAHPARQMDTMDRLFRVACRRQRAPRDHCPQNAFVRGNDRAHRWGHLQTSRLSRRIR